MDQLLIDLENVSLDKLEEFARRFKVDISKCRSKFELIQKLFSETPRQALIEAADDYIYAGRTSLTYFQFEGLRKDFFDDAIIRRLIKKICGGQDPYSKPRRPEI